MAFVTTPAGGDPHGRGAGRRCASPGTLGPTDDHRRRGPGGAARAERVDDPAARGYEVLVDAERDDLDRPFITAHLYNERGPSRCRGNAVVDPERDLPPGGGRANAFFKDAAGAERCSSTPRRVHRLVDHASWQVNRNGTVTVGSGTARWGATASGRSPRNRSMTVDAI